MIRKCLAILSALSLALLLVALKAPVAKATSVYDDTVHLANSLTITSYDGVCRQDVTTTWQQILAAIDPESAASLATAISNGSWGLVMSHQGSGSQQRWALIVDWSETSTGQLYFQYPDDDPSLYMDGMRYYTELVLQHSDNDCQIVNWGLDYNQPDQPVSYRDYSDLKIGFFANTAISYPAGYEGIYVPSAMPTAQYVAMGDSFSSGEGNSPFEYGSDTSSDDCHRSLVAYPRLLEFDSSLNLGATAFVACSGATTSKVLSGQDGESKQIDALSLDTKVVTITIGGNDVGFKNFATACTVSVCNFSTSAYSDIHSKIMNELPRKLEDVYTAIDNATSSDAKIYVIGYPQIAPPEMPTSASSMCWPLNGQGDDPDPTKNDGATAYAVVSELNATINAAVSNFGSTKFQFIDPNLSGSPFEGHDWCQQDRYFDLVQVPNVEASFHPNSDGQAAYAEVVKSQM